MHKTKEPPVRDAGELNVQVPHCQGLACDHGVEDRIACLLFRLIGLNFSGHPVDPLCPLFRVDLRAETCELML